MSDSPNDLLDEENYVQELHEVGQRIYALIPQEYKDTFLINRFWKKPGMNNYSKACPYIFSEHLQV